jgi:tight adherence protein B
MSPAALGGVATATLVVLGALVLDRAAMASHARLRLRVGDAAMPARTAGRSPRPVRRRRRDPAEVVAEQLAAVAREVRAGSSLTNAIATSPTTDPDWALARAVLATLAEHGGPAAEPLDRVAATLRERAALRDERRVHAAAAVLSARLLTWLPILVAGWSVLTSPSVRHVLLATPVGWACLTGGVVLNLLGRHWTARIIRSAA